jgi:hypothetical protein
LTLFAEETVVWWASKVLFTVDGAVVLAFGLFQDNTVPDTSGKGRFPDEVNDPSFGTNFDVAANQNCVLCVLPYYP